MLNFKTIMCPVDISLEQDEALPIAAELARAYNALLVVCYARAGTTLIDTPAPATEHEAISALLERSLALGVEAMPELEWQSAVINGGDYLAQAITDAAAERKADLIVMRSRRRPRLAALLGSTTETICRTAPCPVFVIHPDGHHDWMDAATHRIDLQRVLVAHDFSAHSELALRYALSLAQEYAAELHLLHVVPPPMIGEPEIAWRPSSAADAYLDVERRLRAAVPPEAYLWCQVHHAIHWGKPYQEILAYTERHAIDLVCIGAHDAGFGFGELFGSNIDRVLRQAPCPVLVARALTWSHADQVENVKCDSAQT